MKQTIFILIILLCGCIRNQESKQSKNNNSIISNTETESKYDTLFTKEYEHFNLSREFDIKVNLKRCRNTIEQHDSCFVKLFLTDKSTKKVIDSISISSHFYFEDVFMDRNNTLSYATKFNIDKEIVNNYYGDIIIADLNFDKKDDIAIINDSGGNGGTFYSYFLQDSKKKFNFNEFLTDSMTYFPTKINSKNNTLITYVHGGVCRLGEHIYQLNKRTNNWTEKSHRAINFCKE